MRLKAMFNGGIIPRKYTSDGDNISPKLEFEDVPEGTRFIRITCNDIDAVKNNMPWRHWDITVKGNLRAVPDNFSKGMSRFIIKQRPNSWGNSYYEGPKPPRGSGKHRYVFSVFAYDADKNKIGMASVTGTYERN